MNNTLTGLGLALVLALLAALVGPWFVNWSAYRDDFAARASALVGAPVKMTGAVDARLLPTPYVRFRGLTSGTGATQLSVDEIEIELAIAPLMRGEFKAERVKLLRPRIGVEIAADGAVRTAFTAGARGPKTTADRVSFDRAEIVDGAIAATAPSGVYRLDRISGVAEAGSLAGPYRFDGSAGDDKRRMDLRLSTARPDQTGLSRVKLAAQRTDRSFTLEIDGGLRAVQKFAFDGRVAVSRPPRRDAKAAPDGSEPWSASASVKLEGGGLRFGDLDLAYGADDRGLRFGGSGAAKLGAAPRLDLRLETRQIDFDRLLGERRPRAPADILAEIAARLPAALSPPADGSFALDARGVVLAGEVVQDVRLELDAEAGRWRARRAWATLPGEAKVVASGDVSFSGAEPGFAGPVEFDARDLPGFKRWLAGGRQEGSAPVRRFALKGDVSARRGSVTVENATLTTDGARSTGRVAWTAGGQGERSRFEAALVSDRLDLDALGVDRALSQALSAENADGFVAIDAKTLTAWGVTMRDVSLDAAFDAGELDLKRLDVGDLGGAKISGAGRISEGADGPEGTLAFDLQAGKLDALVAVARAMGAPAAAVAALERRSAALAPVDLKIDVEAAQNRRRVTLAGSAAGGRIDGAISAAALSLDAPAEIDLQVSTPDGVRLAALAGVALSPAAEARGGEARLRLSGAPASGMTGEGRFAALGLELSSRGSVSFSPAAGLSAEGDLSLRAGDVGALAASLGRTTPAAGPRLPASLSARLAWSPEELRLDGLKGEIAGRPVEGALKAPADPAKPIEGRFAMKELPLAALVGLAVGPEALANAGTGWPAIGFGPSPVRGALGRFEISAERMPFGAGQTATDARFALVMRRDAVAIEGFSAALDDGRLSGAATISRAGEAATASLDVSLEKASAERLLGLDARTSPALGTADLRLEAQGSGRTIADLVGSMTGAGALTLGDVRISRLDPSAIDRIEPRVEAGLSLDAAKISAELAKEFAAGDLRLPRVSVPFTLSGGVARAASLDASTDAFRLGGGGAVDFRRLTLDAELTLQPARPDAPQVGLDFAGPLAAPVRRVDATSFTGWLSVRAVERETKRIEAMEVDARERARIARERQEEERKRAEAEKARLEAERRKAEAERRRRDAETGALIDALPRAATPGPSALDASPQQLQPSGTLRAPSAPSVGGFAPQPAPTRTPDRARAGPAFPDALPAPQSILPPAAAPAR